MTKKISTYHLHTTFCDGKNTPDEMVQFALSKGFDSIGFSGHSYMSFSEGWSMSLSGTEDYKKHIKELKEKVGALAENRRLCRRAIRPRSHPSGADIAKLQGCFRAGGPGRSGAAVL